MSEEKKNEWGLPSIGIPSEILFNPLVSHNEKVLFGFIRNLSANTHGCFASNAYLGNLIGVTTVSISRIIISLEEFGYILVERKGVSGNYRRVIKVNDNASVLYSPLVKMVHSKIKSKKSWFRDKEILDFANIIKVLIDKLGQGCLTLVLNMINTGVKHDYHWCYSRLTLVLNILERESEYDNIKEDFNVFNILLNRIGSDDPTLWVGYTDCKNEQPFIQESDSQHSEKQNDNTFTQEVENEEVESLKQEENSPPPKREIPKNPIEKVEKEIKYPPYVFEIVDYWKTLGLTKHKQGNKIFNQIYVILKDLKRGVFFNQVSELQKYHNYKFTDEEIKESIKNFSLAACNPDYKPDNDYKRKLKSTTFPQFIFNSFSEKVKSLFLHYHENRPELIEESQRIMKDPEPKVTEIIKHKYAKFFLGNVVPEKWSMRDERNFRMICKKLLTWREKNGKQVLSNFSNWSNLIDLFMESIQENSEDKTIGTSWLNNSFQFDTRFPNYLHKMGVLKS